MSPATRQPCGSRLALGLKIVLAMYVLAATLLPLAHHDVVCHAKTPTHCTTCVVSWSGGVAADPAALARVGLDDFGAACTSTPSHLSSRAAQALSGRAPPAST
jgi:hypothetical protein